MAKTTKVNASPQHLRHYIQRVCAFYLPQRWRRWFIYLPLNISFIAGVLTLTILLRAAQISTAPLYSEGAIAEEVLEQFKHMQQIVERSAANDRLEIYSGYSEICGEGIEWNYGFYVFYAMSLEALVKREPQHAEFAAKQIDICTRLMMQIPVNANQSEIENKLDEPGEFAASLVSGYQCLVLSIRRTLVNDSLYDATIKGMADALEDELRDQLKHCGQVYTSDQSTQLYAISRADHALGTNHSDLFKQWLQTMQSKFIETETGLLYSLVSINPDRIDSAARATSVAWSIIFLSEIYPEFAEQQYQALLKYRVRRFGNLAAFAEFPTLNILDFGDMDSGPMLLGISPSATGFGLCAHRLYGTQSDYTRSYRIFEIFGLPKTTTTGKYYYMGNGMGDAILLYSKIAPRRGF